MPEKNVGTRFRGFCVFMTMQTGTVKFSGQKGHICIKLPNGIHVAKKDTFRSRWLTRYIVLMEPKNANIRLAWAKLDTLAFKGQKKHF